MREKILWRGERREVREERKTIVEMREKDECGKREKIVEKDER